jgi:hypothetical protein
LWQNGRLGEALWHKRLYKIVLYFLLISCATTLQGMHQRPPFIINTGMLPTIVLISGHNSTAAIIRSSTVQPAHGFIPVQVTKNHLANGP